MTIAGSIWLTIGVVLGGAHAASLWCAAARVSALLAAMGLLRLLVVAAILIGAAFAGGVVPACAGWALGFPIAGLFFWMRGKTS